MAGKRVTIRDVASSAGVSHQTVSLVRQDTTSVGLVIPDLKNPFFTEVASAALEEARRRGWHVVVYDTAGDREQELGTLEVIGSQVDAIVGYLSAPADVVARYTGGIPVVYIGRESAGASFGSIPVDGEAGIHAAVAHLVALGRRRIGVLDHEHVRPSASALPHELLEAARHAAGDPAPARRIPRRGPTFHKNVAAGAVKG
jgi:LacI family transcriptional regulator